MNDRLGRKISILGADIIFFSWHNSHGHCPCSLGPHCWNNFGWFWSWHNFHDFLSLHLRSLPNCH
ncbi:hypothetical protein Ahy_A06g030539 isoform B [Arachis hypogaea]|nr:hypothetical protein Ahy_A06g030539 isoform B [Arachis hypogaea]